MGKKGKITDEGRLQKLAEARKKSLEIRRAKAAERKAAKAKKKEEASEHIQMNVEKKNTREAC